jgi:hypothetical protein
MIAGALSRPAGSIRVLLWMLASALFVLLLTSLFRTDTIAAAPLVVVTGLAAVSAWRPDSGLLLVAGLVPIAGWIGRRWDGSLAWPEAVAVAFLAGYTLNRAVRRPSIGRSLPTIAIYSLIAIVVASLAVHVLVLKQTIGSEALRALAGDVLAGEYFRGAGGPELDAAMRLIEGLLLLHAALTLASVRGRFAPLAVRTIVIAAGAAGALNLWRIWLGALQLESPVRGFVSYLATLRYNAHYGDLNAAGSYFMMTLLPALMLAWGREWRRWTPAVIFIGLSLILSGSRTAIVAGVVAALGAWYLARRQSAARGARTTAANAAVVAVLTIACLGAGVLLAARNASPASGSVWIRVEFARASLRMLGTAPLFGVGIGQYPGRAGEFTSAALVTVYPPAAHENAHNNFLQLLSELGIIGLGAFLWLIGASATAVAARLGHDPHDGLRWSAVAGAASFVVSWLGGHPLLVDAPAFSFWILLGALTGWGEIDAPPARRTSVTIISTAVLVIVLLVSLPFRVQAEFGRTELDHQGIGLSLWQDADDGVRYRLAGGTSTVFVPASARVITVPLRAAADQELTVELRLDNRLADVVRVPGGRWLMLRVPMPDDDSARYRALAFRVRGAGADRESPLLMIGKVTPQ